MMDFTDSLTFRVCLDVLIAHLFTEFLTIRTASQPNIWTIGKASNQVHKVTHL